MNVKPIRKANQRQMYLQRLAVLTRRDRDPRRGIRRRLCCRQRLELEEGVEICGGHNMAKARLALNLRLLLRLL